MAALFGDIAQTSPIPCPDVSSCSIMSFMFSRRLLTNVLQVLRDQILLGLAAPESCCSYGMCKGDVNVQGG